MNILFVTEYFYPFIHGGAEISIRELARALTHSGQDIHILTPNYGTVPFEKIDNVKIHRFFFRKKFKNFYDQFSPIWYFNPLFIFILLFQIVRIVRAEKIKIIHVHGLFSLPSAVVAGKLFRIPVIVTFRDAQILCNYGNCLSVNQFGRTCSLKAYFFEDFLAYRRNKVPNKNVFTFFIQIAFAVIGRIRTKILKKFAKYPDVLLVSSIAQQKTFAVNGFKTKVIHNIFSFPTKYFENPPHKRIILYATKMSSGKGLDLLLKALQTILFAYPDIRLMIVGSGDKKYYESMCNDLEISSNVEILGRKTPNEVMAIRRGVLLEVCPSVYPESFGRTALEALASGVPVVASNRGGFTDIVEDGKTGYVVNPTVNEFAGAIIQGISNNQKLRKNIGEEYLALKNKFEMKPLEDHIKLYKSLIK